ncbi:MAG TPA: ATP-binding protein, partial [Thermohalobaculum sp.]|nr:ATP-binding protein [Thermohalobaculum sp.]
MDRRGDSPEATRAAVVAELDRLTAGGLLGVSPGAALGVAVSGGGDSTALLMIAQGWAVARGVSLAAASVDHRLRPESRAEAASVAALCARLGVSHAVLVAGDLRAAPGNLAAAAREARLALLAG